MTLGQRRGLQDDSRRGGVCGAHRPVAISTAATVGLCGNQNFGRPTPSTRRRLAGLISTQRSTARWLGGPAEEAERPDHAREE